MFLGEKSFIIWVLVFDSLFENNILPEPVQKTFFNFLWFYTVTEILHAKYYGEVITNITFKMYFLQVWENKSIINIMHVYTMYTYKKLVRENEKWTEWYRQRNRSKPQIPRGRRGALMKQRALLPRQLKDICLVLAWRLWVWRSLCWVKRRIRFH